MEFDYFIYKPIFDIVHETEVDRQSYCLKIRTNEDIQYTLIFGDIRQSNKDVIERKER